MPEPDGPTMQITSPRCTSRSMPLSTSVRPNDLRTPTALTIGGVPASLTGAAARTATSRPDGQPPTAPARADGGVLRVDRDRYERHAALAPAPESWRRRRRVEPGFGRRPRSHDAPVCSRDGKCSPTALAELGPAGSPSAMRFPSSIARAATSLERLSVCHGSRAQRTPSELPAVDPDPRASEPLSSRRRSPCARRSEQRSSPLL